MFVISLRCNRKKLLLAAKILLILCLFLLFVFFVNRILWNPADQTVLFTESMSVDENGAAAGEDAAAGDAADGEEQSYPGEPIRVHQSLEQYWLEMLSSVEL